MLQTLHLHGCHCFKQWLQLKLKDAVEDMSEEDREKTKMESFNFIIFSKLN